MIHAREILVENTPNVMEDEAVGGKTLSEEAQEASNKMNRCEYIFQLRSISSHSKVSVKLKHYTFYRDYSVCT